MSPQLCSLVDRAIQLNNRAVWQAVAGNDKSAIVMFGKAITLFQSILSKLKELKCINSHDTSSLEPAIKLHQLPHLNKHFSLYDRMITFAPFTKNEPCRKSECMAYCSSILLNMALVYHRQALAGRRDRLLAMAVRLYSRILQFVPDTKKSEGRGNDTHSIGVRRAALHNLQRIFSKMTRKHNQVLLNGVEAIASKPQEGVLSPAA